MLSRYNWLYVPPTYGLMMFAVLMVIWRGGVDPGELDSSVAFQETGTPQWMARQAAFDATVALVITVVLLGVVPPIRVKHVALISSAIVLLNWLIAPAYIAINGT